MRQFTFITHQTLAGLRGWAGPDSSSTVRPTTPIPNSKSAAAAARGPSVSPPPSDVGGAKQLSQYFWLRRGRGWRLQIAIFNMLLQPEGGGLHILFPSDRCAAAEAKNKAENPPQSPL